MSRAASQLAIEESEDILPLLDDLLPNGRGLIAMLKVFLDRAAKRDTEEEIVSVGCVIFKPTPYKQFVRPWRRMLRAWAAQSFHATDFYSGGGEFKRKGNPELERLFETDSKRIPTMVGGHLYCARTISFFPDEFLPTAPPGWTKHYGTSVHSHAVQMCLIFNGFWRQETCPYESFAYFMESGDPDCGEISSIVEKMRHHQHSRLIKVTSFSTVEKGQMCGTDAADFIAWHWNKYYMDKLKKGQRTNPRKDLRAFTGIAANKLYHTQVSGEYLRQFFSLVPVHDKRAER
jgi:hypothetical protein